MSIDGVDGQAIVFESQRIELKDLENQTRSFFFRLPSIVPSGSVMRTYIWNRYQQDIPITGMEVMLMRRQVN